MLRKPIKLTIGTWILSKWKFVISLRQRHLKKHAKNVQKMHKDITLKAIIIQQSQAEMNQNLIGC